MIEFIKVFGALMGICAFVGFICLRIELTELQRQLASFLNRKAPND